MVASMFDHIEKPVQRWTRCCMGQGKPGAVRQWRVSWDVAKGVTRHPAIECRTRTRKAY